MAHTISDVLHLANARVLEATAWLLVQSFAAGLLAFFTPYVYTIHPFTIGYLRRNVPDRTKRIMNTAVYALSVMLVVTVFGIIISVLVRVTGLRHFTEHWIFNLFFFRFFLTLAVSFLGAFAIKLPASWIQSIAARAKAGSTMGIFFMAVTLPIASFSSTAPMLGVVLVLAAKTSDWGPAVGLLGFSAGLVLPFAFPALTSTFSRSKSLLNNVKVIMGFFSIMIALKFLSVADISLGLHILERDTFLMVWMSIWAFMGVYMLGRIKLYHDQETEENMYGQQYTSMSRLFIGAAAFVFALYLLPGLWGAPLNGVSGFLPP